MPSTTREYLDVLATHRGDALVVTTMTAARVWSLVSPVAHDVNYLPSAMSHASDMALGLALARPSQRVVCVNGDGSLLMNLGSLVTAAHCRASNLVQIVIVNDAYLITGGSPIPGRATVDWPGLARAAGWPVAVHCDEAAVFAELAPSFLSADGPVLISVAVVDPPDLAMRLPPVHPGESLRILRKMNTVSTTATP